MDRVKIEQGIGVWYALQSEPGFPVWNVYVNGVLHWDTFRTLESAQLFVAKRALAVQS